LLKRVASLMRSLRSSGLLCKVWFITVRRD
jgi:hypothetical protein